MKKFFKRAVILLVVLLAAIQLVPYGRSHTNPAAIMDTPWPDADAAAAARRACYDCHSNETVWPWYAHVAPASWLIQRDVDKGRRHLNFSDWQKYGRKAVRETKEVFEEGEMPPWFYTPLHSGSKLSKAEQDAILLALQKIAPPPAAAPTKK